MKSLASAMLLSNRILTSKLAITTSILLLSSSVANVSLAADSGFDDAFLNNRQQDGRIGVVELGAATAGLGMIRDAIGESKIEEGLLQTHKNITRLSVAFENPKFVNLAKIDSQILDLEKDIILGRNPEAARLKIDDLKAAALKDINHAEYRNTIQAKLKSQLSTVEGARTAKGLRELKAIKWLGAVGIVALVADGGRRIANSLSGADPGYSPSVIETSRLQKRVGELPALPASDVADTSMSVQ